MAVFNRYASVNYNVVMTSFFTITIIKVGSHVPFFAPFFVSGTFDVINVMCEQYNTNAFSPFLNGEKNGAKTLSVNKALGYKKKCTRYNLYYQCSEV